MISQFFIDRPIFAWVIAIVIMLAGAIVDPFGCRSRSIRRSRRRRSRSARPIPARPRRRVEDTVTQVIEQQLNGIDDLLYISSTANSTARRPITLTFDAGHQSRHRAGAGAEQAAARDAAAAAGGAAAGRPRQQVARATSCMVVALHLDRRQHDQRRHRRLRRVATLLDPISARRRRRRRAGVRLAVRDAHLARPGQAQRLTA